MENTFEIIPAGEIEKAVAGLDKSEAVALKASFAAFIEDAGKWGAKAKALVVTDATQVSVMKQAREMRLTLKDVRCGVENARKDMKAEYLRKGQAIDGLANLLKGFIEPVEAHLLYQEKFAERAEAEQKAKLRDERVKAIAPYLDTFGAGMNAIEELPEEAFTALLAGAKAGHAAKLEAAKQAEEARVAKAKADAAESERIRAENDRLKAEKAAADAVAGAEREKVAAAQRVKDEAARKEREAIEEKARAAQAEADKAKAEAQRLRDEEAARLAKIEAEKKRAALAPDCDKLRELAKRIRALGVPVMTTEAGGIVQAKVVSQVEKFALWLESEAVKLNGEGA